MEVNPKKIALMFVTKRRFRQKKGTIHYPETDSYKHLGTIINRKGALTKHFKPVASSMLRTASALIRIRNNQVPPKETDAVVFYSFKSGAGLPWPDPSLTNERD